MSSAHQLFRVDAGPAIVAARCCLPTPRFSARFSAPTTAWSDSGRTSPRQV